MTRMRWIVIAIVLLGVAWVWLMGSINSRHTSLDVRVSGSVERVLFYAVDEPSAPVAHIVTRGQDAQLTVDLANAARHSLWAQSAPAQYYFITTAGEENYRSPTVCLETEIVDRQQSLVIRGLRDWEQPAP
jgi:hypothetical protein